MRLPLADHHRRLNGVLEFDSLPARLELPLPQLQNVQRTRTEFAVLPALRQLIELVCTRAHEELGPAIVVEVVDDVDDVVELVVDDVVELVVDDVVELVVDEVVVDVVVRFGKIDLTRRDTHTAPRLEAGSAPVPSST